MRNMTREEKRDIEREIYLIMRSAVSSDYARCILEQKDGCTNNTFIKDVIDDVLEPSAWEDEGYYNEDDIRLAIGRVLIDRLRIDHLKG